MSKHKLGIYEKYVKRPQDFLCALAATVVLSPVILITAVLIRIKLGAPVIFTQERPGKDGKIFKLYKFRTMTNAKDENGELLSDEVRLTKFGKILRSTSLDELPELFNMLKGDMSVVGPRPLLVKYLPLYNENQARRHEVRPGFTGLAQVNGRNAITWEEKFDWDIKYVDNITFLGDWKIIFKTVITVLKRDGISSETSATMEEFRGTNLLTRKTAKGHEMKKLAIIGASGHGKVIADIARKNGYKEIVFLDDNKDLRECGGYPVTGSSSDANHIDADVIVGIGNADIRKRIQESIPERKLATLVHPNAVVADDVVLGVGTVVMAGAVINPGTKIGKGCIINTCSSVDHDCEVNDYVHVSVGSHLCGTVFVGSKTWIGAGTTVSNNVVICSDCMIGAGAVIINDIKERGTYVGVPARRTK